MLLAFKAFDNNKYFNKAFFEVTQSAIILSYMILPKYSQIIVPLILNSLFVVKSGIRYTNKFVGTICNSNMRSLNVIINALSS